MIPCVILHGSSFLLDNISAKLNHVHNQNSDNHREDAVQMKLAVVDENVHRCQGMKKERSGWDVVSSSRDPHLPLS